MNTFVLAFAIGLVGALVGVLLVFLRRQQRRIEQLEMNKSVALQALQDFNSRVLSQNARILTQNNVIQYLLREMGMDIGEGDSGIYTPSEEK